VRSESVWRTSIYNETGSPAPVGAQSGLSVRMPTGGWMTFTDKHHDLSEMSEILSKNPRQLLIVLDHINNRTNFVGDNS
jgi:hypothetical protein